MDHSNAQLKDIARANLLGNYSTPMLAWVISAVIVAVLEAPFRPMFNTGIQGRSTYHIIIGILGMIVISLIGSLLGSGVCYIHLKLARRINIKLGDMFFPFQNHPDKFIGFYAIIMLISGACSIPGGVILTIGAGNRSVAMILLGTVVTAAGCIILIYIMLGLSQTICLLLDKPHDIRVAEAMRESQKLMKGKKKQLFVLGLSFIPWFLLGILSCGIGMLFVMPYYQQSLVAFYLAVRRENLPQIE